VDLVFRPAAWEHYLYWQQTDRRMVKRINQLLEDICRHPCEGMGKPEPLKHELAGCWSRRINREHRVVYRVKDGCVEIVQLRYHY